MVPALKTSRLHLEPLSLQDADAIQVLFPQWEIVKYLTEAVPWPYPPDGALQFIRDHALPAMERGEAWHWTLRPRVEPERIIGVISLMKGEENNRGFWLDPAWQRQGLMTEAVAAATRFWFEILRFPRLRVPKAVANLPSRRISERSGMRVVEVKEAPHLAGILPMEIWEITAEEWAAWQQREGGGKGVL
jgi:ribosomal-protein-alanine N-acetyltransferase